MNFVLNKQTGVFVLREDLTSGIKAAARDLADLEGKKLKTLEDVTRESEREYNNAKKTKEQKKTEFDQAYARLAKNRGRLLTFKRSRQKVAFNTIEKAKVTALFIENQNNPKPSKQEVNDYLQQLTAYTDIKNDQMLYKSVVQDLNICANYSDEQKQISSEELDGAIENVKIVLAGGELLSLIFEVPEVAAVIMWLHKKLCISYPEKYDNLIPLAGDKIDHAIGTLKLLFNKDTVKRLLINSVPVYGTINIIKSFYIVIKYHNKIPDCKKSIETNSEEPTQQKEQPQNQQQTNNNTNSNENEEDTEELYAAERDQQYTANSRNKELQARLQARKARSLRESKILKEYREEINNLLIPHMQKQLGFNHPPTINFAEDSENAQDMFGKTAYYNPSTSEITVYITNRHPKDIMRSVAHEIVHHAQNQRGEFENSFNLGEEGYAQNNSHLRSMEEEAYLSGNMIFRDWEDNFKKQRNQNKMINESSLRAKIRSMIKEEINEEEHSSDCDCKECANKREILKARGNLNLQGFSEQVEKEIVPLKEWRNMELNSLLLNRFGIVSPQVLGEKTMTPKEKELAAKYPPEDKITRGDVITAAKEKGGKSAKKPTKKGKVPPQFLKKGK
jgi:hypothetical protein